MYIVFYTQNAQKDLLSLEEKTAQRIIEKITFFSQQGNVFLFAKALKENFGEGRYRFRIGDYRAIFSIAKDGQIQILKILRIKHRKDIYKK